MNSFFFAMGNKIVTYGIIGNPLSHSFSKRYFSEKLQNLGLLHQKYENFEIDTASDIIQIFQQNPSLRGLNVTYPFKEKIIDYIDGIDAAANEVGAVNVIKISNGITTGYNTDINGFESSITPYLKPNYNKALILGTGGAAKAVAYVLKKLRIKYLFVSRNAIKDNYINYSDLQNSIFAHQIIINATPIGMYPEINNFPDIPYNKIESTNLLFDLIYNPEETLFLKKGNLQGATTINGLKMLIYQADKAWEIWNK